MNREISLFSIITPCYNAEKSVFSDIIAFLSHQIYEKII